MMQPLLQLLEAREAKGCVPCGGVSSLAGKVERGCGACVGAAARAGAESFANCLDEYRMLCAFCKYTLHACRPLRTDP